MALLDVRDRVPEPGHEPQDDAGGCSRGSGSGIPSSRITQYEARNTAGIRRIAGRYQAFALIRRWSRARRSSRRTPRRPWVRYVSTDAARRGMNGESTALAGRFMGSGSRPPATSHSGTERANASATNRTTSRRWSPTGTCRHDASMVNATVRTRPSCMNSRTSRWAPGEGTSTPKRTSSEPRPSMGWTWR